MTATNLKKGHRIDHSQIITANEKANRYYSPILDENENKVGEYIFWTDGGPFGKKTDTMIGYPGE